MNVGSLKPGGVYENVDGSLLLVLRNDFIGMDFLGDYYFFSYLWLTGINKGEVEVNEYCYDIGLRVEEFK